MSAAVYRAPMRARDHDAAPGAGAELGLEQGVVGIGDKTGRRLERFAELPDGSFVWTRDAEGLYHLGAVAGPWRRDDSPAARAVGIRNVRPARWLPQPVAEDDVPTAVLATFARGGRNLQRIHDARAERETAALWDAAAAG
ncbi:MAG: hypothetical protein JWQ18_2078 [Conexibacter sp.]|nr:hypothetical protein [Conexibacter sp.]